MIASGQQTTIRCAEVRRPSSAVLGQHLSAGAHIPEPDNGISPATGKYMPIRGKGYAIDDISMPAHPEKASVLHVPQLDPTIVARTRQSASIRAEALQASQQRAAALGGEVAAGPEESGGFRVSLRLPFGSPNEKVAWRGKEA